MPVCAKHQRLTIVALLFQVLENELQALQKACEELEHDYRPGITFVVVQKRHHVRFFPVDDRDKVCAHVHIHNGSMYSMSHQLMYFHYWY